MFRLKYVKPLEYFLYLTPAFNQIKRNKTSISKTHKLRGNNQAIAFSLKFNVSKYHNLIAHWYETLTLSNNQCYSALNRGASHNGNVFRKKLFIQKRWLLSSLQAMGKCKNTKDENIKWIAKKENCLCIGW